MDIRKLDKLTSRRSLEMEIPGVGRSIFPPGTEFIVGRQNSRFVYLYSNGGDPEISLDLAIECRILQREINRVNFDWERDNVGIAARNEKYFGAAEKPEAADEKEPTPVLNIRRRRA